MRGTLALQGGEEVRSCIIEGYFISLYK